MPLHAARPSHSRRPGAAPRCRPLHEDVGLATPKALTRLRMFSRAGSIMSAGGPSGAAQDHRDPALRGRARAGAERGSPTPRGRPPAQTKMIEAQSPRVLFTPTLVRSSSTGTGQSSGSAAGGTSASVQEDLEVLHDLAISCRWSARADRAGSGLPSGTSLDRVVHAVVDVELVLRLPHAAPVHVALVGQDHRGRHGRDAMPSVSSWFAIAAMIRIRSAPCTASFSV